MAYLEVGGIQIMAQVFVTSYVESIWGLEGAVGFGV